MGFRIILFIWKFLLDILELFSMSEHEKDIRILLLQQQLRIAERQQKRTPSLTRWEKIPLAALAKKLKGTSNNAKQSLETTIRFFKPATLIKWHHQLVRRKWTFDNTPKMGRPPLSPEIERWIVTIARENPSFGYDKIEGEIRKLGFQASSTTIRNLLLKHGIPPGYLKIMIYRCDSLFMIMTLSSHSLSMLSLKPRALKLFIRPSKHLMPMLLPNDGFGLFAKNASINFSAT